MHNTRMLIWFSCLKLLQYKLNLCPEVLEKQQVLSWRKPKYSSSEFRLCNLSTSEAAGIIWGNCLASSFGFCEDLVLWKISKRHTFVFGKDLFPELWEGPQGSHLALAAMTWCAEAVAEDTGGIYRAARAGLEVGTAKPLWDKLSTGNEGRSPAQHGQSSTAHSKEEQH